MAAIERLTHDLDIADALKRIIHATVGQIDDCGHHIVDLSRVEEVRHAEFFGQRAPVRIQIHTDDLIRPGDARTLDDVEADTA